MPATSRGIPRLPDVGGDKRMGRFAVARPVDRADRTGHRLTRPDHPRTSGQVERMNRTIGEATVRRLHHENHGRLRAHPADFMAAWNCARRLKAPGRLTPYEYICGIWTSAPVDSSQVRSLRCQDRTPGPHCLRPVAPRLSLIGGPYSAASKVKGSAGANWPETSPASTRFMSTPRSRNCTGASSEKSSREKSTQNTFGEVADSA